MFFLNEHFLHEISGFEKNPATSKFEIEATVPRLSLVGKYKVNGKGNSNF